MNAAPDPGTLVDTNVLIDVITGDPSWYGWSSQALSDAADDGEVVINQVIYAELAAGFARIEDLDAAIPPGVFKRLDIPWPAAFLASRVWIAHAHLQGRSGTAPLPDFLIGAHAAVAGMRLLTRDPRAYRTRFPGLQLICP